MAGLTDSQVALFDALGVGATLDAPARSGGQTEEQARNVEVEGFRYACMLDADEVPGRGDVLAYWRG